MTGRQLILDLPPRQGMGRDDFLPAPSNEAALAALENWRGWPGHTMLLVGPEGSGRTHLAHIWAGETGGAVIPAGALDAATLPATEALPTLAVDDVEAVAGDPAAEEALFHLMNRARHAARPLLLTARPGAGSRGIALPDLQSRLQGAARTTIDAPDETLIAMALVKLCDDRQLAVSEAALRYLAARLDRSLAAARAVVDAMDRIAVTEGRPVTRQLAAEALAGLTAPPEFGA